METRLKSYKAFAGPATYMTSPTHGMAHWHKSHGDNGQVALACYRLESPSCSVRQYSLGVVVSLTQGIGRRRRRRHSEQSTATLMSECGAGASLRCDCCCPIHLPL